MSKNRPVVRLKNNTRTFSTLNMTVAEIAKKIREGRENGESVTFSFGHENKIIRKGIMNGQF